MPSSAVEERHATWLELFFDLVIVVAVAQLAALLHDGPGRREVFLFVVCYYAMWSVWTSFTLYANVSGDLTRIRSMLLAMFGIAIMAAAVPHVIRGDPAWFIAAYVFCRLMGAGSWKRTSRIMTEWPGVQQAAGVIPWIASLGFEPPVRYYLWAAGIVLDVVVSLVRSRHPEQLLAEEQRELEEAQRHRDRRLGILRRLRLSRPGVPAAAAAPRLQAARPDRPHLGERLGLFVIIVLGEAVAQLIDAASDVERWELGLMATLAAGFGLLVALWWLTLRYGSDGAPTYGTRVFTLRLTMPAHYLMTGSIVLIAAGLGVLADHAGEPVPEASRWVLCSGAALYFLTVSLLGARGGAPRRWLAGWGLPAVVASLLLGVFGGPLAGWALAASLFAVAGWHVLYRPGSAAAETEPAAAEMDVSS
ncbi:low temperature requirement protein A [Actinoplanes nipponensis]|uniref:low temperature requirement protein A n=1 Tax=Actinoplanes nipponensis TaxID=135950 RepID=UPI001943AD43|nr:low temperature requirement protein A [Actinoplanes nipponensis]